MATRARLWVLTMTAVALGGCLEDQLPEGVFDCRPGEPRMCPEGWVCRPVQCPLQYRCFRPDPGERPEYPAGCVEDGLCDRDACESCLSCPGDCCPTCDQERLAALAPAEYLVDSYWLPTSSAEAQEHGVDLDGDGLVDNKLGSIASLITANADDGSANDIIAARVASGDLLVAGRLYLERFAGDGEHALAQVLVADARDATLLFDGHDVVAISPDASVSTYLCGELVDGVFLSNPSSGVVRFPIPFDVVRGESVVVTVHRARLTGRVDGSGWWDVQFGGGLTRETLLDEFYPWWVDLMNARIAANPQGGTAQTLLPLLDDACVEIEGCDPLPEGCVEDGWIHLDELRCNALIDSAFAPDVDSDNDGGKDLISVGVTLGAVRATLLEP